jgi:hypothetical protein
VRPLRVRPPGGAPTRAPAARAARARGAAARVAALLAGALASGLGGVLAPQPLGAQTSQAVVLADTIRVGDVVPVAVRVTAGPGDRVILPPMLDLAGDLENAARMRERLDTLADGGIQVTGVYAITPWRPGMTPLPDLAIQVLGPAGEVRTVTASLPPLEVLSVLPVDAQLLEPMPARGVLGRSWAWWPFILLAIGILLLAAALWWWLRRRAPAAVAAEGPAVSPRDAALAALHHARAAGLIERAEWKEFYTRVSLALREYLQAVEPAWSDDLTTTELLARVRADAGHDVAVDLAALLRPADQVKFARYVPDADGAIAEWEAACRWVERFSPPHQLAPVEEAA